MKIPQNRMIQKELVLVHEFGKVFTCSPRSKETRDLRTRVSTSPAHTNHPQVLFHIPFTNIWSNKYGFWKRNLLITVGLVNNELGYSLWFLDNNNNKNYIEKNYEYFKSKFRLILRGIYTKFWNIILMHQPLYFSSYQRLLHHVENPWLALQPLLS